MPLSAVPLPESSATVPLPSLSFHQPTGAAMVTANKPCKLPLAAVTVSELPEAGVVYSPDGLIVPLATSTDATSDAGPRSLPNWSRNTALNCSCDLAETVLTLGRIPSEVNVVTTVTETVLSWELPLLSVIMT